MPETETYDVLRRISYSRRTERQLNKGNFLYEPGDTIDLEADEAKPLLETEAIARRRLSPRQAAAAQTTPPAPTTPIPPPPELDLSPLDPEKVLVLVSDEQPEEGEFELLNLNTASKADLLSLKHVGVGTYDKWEAHRSKQPIASLDEAQKIAGMTDEKWNEIKDTLTV